MGASRKLQTEIDRVLKKVHEGVQEFDTIWDKVYETDNANLKEKFEGDLKKEIKKLQRYRDQIKTWQQSSEIKDKKALMDARKLIEREMERFKVCEKETKTKAFSKEGLGQQPKTDPKEKAKSETRDWLNNVVGDLESQIDNFEAELEGISGKKGKTRNPQLTRLEASIGRHKAHVLKLELILRLLDNDELSPDQVNDLKYYLDDYIECNQVDFERFSNIDELYVSLPLDKVEALEDMVTVTLGSSGLVKAALLSAPQQSADQDQSDETASLDSNADTISKTPPAKTVAAGPLVSSSASPSLVSGTLEVPISAATSSSAVHTLLDGPGPAAALAGTAAVRGVTGESAAFLSSSLGNSSDSVKEADNNVISDSGSSATTPETGLEKVVSRGTSYQESIGASMSLNSVSGVASSGSLGSFPVVSDLSKRNISSINERREVDSIPPTLAAQLSNRMQSQQISKFNADTLSNDNVGEGTGIGGRSFSHSIATSQWTPQSAASFQNPAEIRGRPEIAPDQREKYLQRLQQVQQQGHGALLSVPHLPGANHKQFPMQHENSILQQFNSQGTSLPPQLGLGLNLQSSGASSVASTPLQSPIHHLTSQIPLISTGPKDVDIGHSKGEQQQQNLSDDMKIESAQVSGLSNKSDDNLKTPLSVMGTTGEGSQLPRESDLSPGQPLLPSQSSSGVGVIGRRSVSDLGAIGENLGGSSGNSGGMSDQFHTLQLLEAALHRLPQPKDSERVKRYVPKHPAVTPSSFPQTQADIIRNPALWKRLGADPLGIDTLFFAFYYQQNTYQQYLAARELKTQAWRFHRQYNTWFQRHEEPDFATDDYEKGSYVYFDFHVDTAWLQRIKNDFTFEYKHLEDDLVI
ncbi:general negative regulator of transcription subunit 3-like isoform X1 [Asparagus officinalis]|uniref:general negative regulator of transcription subunit 3-like isoform X1 n=1 Tax=Asparagus officinalis TaxID=4686 RepID=UPI00098E0802|nr:general negative regulator of transcription subunit 3-like isoform X1 [Asparagus officinalis]